MDRRVYDTRKGQLHSQHSPHLAFHNSKRHKHQRKHNNNNSQKHHLTQASKKNQLIIPNPKKVKPKHHPKPKTQASKLQPPKNHHTILSTRINQPRKPRPHTIRTILRVKLDLARNGVSTEALAIRIVASEMAVFPDSQFGVAADVGYAFEFAHCCCCCGFVDGRVVCVVVVYAVEMLVEVCA